MREIYVIYLIVVETCHANVKINEYERRYRLLLPKYRMYVYDI